MNSIRRITRNTVMLNAARVLSTLGKFFLFIYVARILGEDILGQFTFAIIFTSFFGIAISLGMDDYLVREVARDGNRSKKYLGNMLGMRAVFSLIFVAVIIVIINLMNYPADTRSAVYIFAGYTVFTAFSFLFRANFRAFEKMEWDALLETLEALITTGVGLWVLFAGYGLIPLSLVFLGASVLNVVASVIINRRRFTRPKLEFDAAFWKDTALKAAPFSVFALFILYPRIDTILLSWMKGDAVVGYYNAAYQIIVAFSPVVMNFMIALVPLISRYFLNSKAMLGFTYEKSYKYLVTVAFPVSMAGMVLAPFIIPLLYGEGFTDSVLALQILAWNCLLFAMSRPMFYVLGAIDRQGTCALITLGALVLSIILNIIFVPRWSYVASGAITLVVGFLVTLAGWMTTARFGFRLAAASLLWRPALAGVVMGGVLYFSGRFLTESLIILVPLGIIVYFMVLFFLRGFSGSDLELVRQALHSGRPSTSPAETTAEIPSTQGNR